MKALTLLHQTVSECTRCPRLTSYRREVAKEKVKRFKGLGLLGPSDPWVW